MPAQIMLPTPDGQSRCCSNCLYLGEVVSWPLFEDYRRDRNRVLEKPCVGAGRSQIKSWSWGRKTSCAILGCFTGMWPCRKLNAPCSETPWVQWGLSWHRQFSYNWSRAKFLHCKKVWMEETLYSRVLLVSSVIWVLSVYVNLLFQDILSDLF